MIWVFFVIIVESDAPFYNSDFYLFVKEESCGEEKNLFIVAVIMNS
jgi:hypothetical protein